MSPSLRNRTRLPSAAAQSGITGLSPANLIIVICSYNDYYLPLACLSIILLIADIATVVVDKKLTFCFKTAIIEFWCDVV